MSEVQKAHNGLGHPSKATFLRMMNLANATEAAKRYAKAWECPICARRAAPRKPQVATGELRPNGVNQTMCVDLKYLKKYDEKTLSSVKYHRCWYRFSCIGIPEN